jgi:hypothetical protein
LRSSAWSWYSTQRGTPVADETAVKSTGAGGREGAAGTPMGAARNGDDEDGDARGEKAG